MASKALPKPCAENTLVRKYKELAALSNGRLDIEKESGKQLVDLTHTYLAAFTNLYGILTTAEAWEILRRVEPELVKSRKLVKKDFFLLTDILRVENLPYYIFELEELYCDEPHGKLQDRHLVHKDLVSRGYYRFVYCYELLDAQADDSFCLLSKEEYFKWADQNCFRSTPQAEELMRFLENLRVSKNSKNLDINGVPIHGKPLNSFIFWHRMEQGDYEYAKREWEKKAVAEENNIIESEKLMRDIQFWIQRGFVRITMDDIIKWTNEHLNEVGVILSGNDFVKLSTLIINLNKKSRLRCHRGWSPEQLYMQEHPDFRPVMTFGPGLEKAMECGDIDKEMLIRFLHDKGIDVQ